MNVKNFLIAGIFGSIADFLLGWLFYGILLKDTFPMTGTTNFLYVYLGCLFWALVLSYVFNLGEGISRCVPGIKTAAILGFLSSLSINFFQNISKDVADYKLIGIDVVTSLVLSGLVGAVIAVTLGKLKK